MGSPHRYIPNTEKDIEGMLQDIGVSGVDDLFSDIPPEFRLDRPLDLPSALSEQELMAEISRLASRNSASDANASYLGAGIYDHYVPSVVDHILRRGEFYTAYTPYQAEVSQGTLQVIFEYQTMVCELTGMDVANASLYDAGTAVAEAAIMACSATGRKKVLVTRATNPRYREVLVTYAKPRGIEIVLVDYCPAMGVTLAETVAQYAGPGVACLVAQSPNYFGCVEDMESLGSVVHSSGGLFVAVVNPISLGILAPPGSYGADIALGEGQALGNPMNFGGPLLGFFATTNALIRRMPGRLVGQTQDSSGRRGFVLTLQAREQHIRRESATSNICSNEALCALAAAVYLSLMGPGGLRRVAELCTWKAHYVRDRIAAIPNYEIPFNGPFFNEFVVRAPGCPVDRNQALLRKSIIGGKPLRGDYPELSGCTLWAVTEKRTREQLDTLVRELEVLV
ncbi:MAG: aminomethyl-transferring glycine dehydrogenase subunit GcvPA [Firmicutes bacterium]|jgi:glycine dehydrogenase subunit 1|nr:aminomethyl-transferring glycine dehydrogenase subunit GcvPA [Bacillota bacterium]